MVDPGGAITGLLDVDDVAAGDPVDDLATLIGHLRFRARGVDPSAPGAGRLLDHVTALHCHAASRVGPGAIDVAVAAVLIGLATGPFRVQRPGWQRDVTGVVADADRGPRRSDRDEGILRTPSRAPHDRPREWGPSTPPPHERQCMMRRTLTWKAAVVGGAVLGAGFGSIALAGADDPSTPPGGVELQRRRAPARPRPVPRCRSSRPPTAVTDSVASPTSAGLARVGTCASRAVRPLAGSRSRRRRRRHRSGRPRPPPPPPPLPLRSPTRRPRRTRRRPHRRRRRRRQRMTPRTPPPPRPAWAPSTADPIPPATAPGPRRPGVAAPGDLARHAPGITYGRRSTDAPEPEDPR